MSDQNQWSSYELVKPILVLMRCLGYKQQMPKQRTRYFFIQCVRFLTLITIIMTVQNQLLVSIKNNNSKGYLSAFLVSFKVILTLVFLRTLGCINILNQRIDLAYSTYKNIKIISWVFVTCLLLNQIIYITFDVVKYTIFENYYILIYMNDMKIDKHNYAHSFHSSFMSVQYFILIVLPMQTSYVYCALNCLIISKMYSKLNSSLESKQYKLISSDIRMIQLSHLRISNQAHRLSRQMSMPLLFIYYNFVTHLCEFTFHIVSYIRDPTVSGK